MKVYTCKFNGYYPVGASAIIVAKDEAHAEETDATGNEWGRIAGGIA